MALPEAINLAVERLDGTLEAAAAGWIGIEHRRQGGPQDAGIGALVAQRGADAGSGNAVASRAGDAFDETVQPQPPQVVGHAARRPGLRRDAEQRRHLGGSWRLSNPLGNSRKASTAHSNACTRAQPKCSAAQRWPLSGATPRLLEIIEDCGSELAVIAETLDAQQASIGGVTQLFELIKVVQPSADIEVVAIVDGSLGAQRAPFLVVLLDARVLIVDVQ